MWHGKGDGLRDCFVREQGVINFARGNFLSPAVDDFVEAAKELDVTVGIDDSLIAGSVSFAPKDALVGGGIILISAEDGRAAHDHLAFHAGRE